MRSVWAILRKEWRSEWRTRYGLNAAVLFAVTSLTAVTFAAGRIPDRVDILSALLWLTLMFAALASMSHAFVRETESRTMLLLRLVASPTQIALGKLGFNLLFLLVVEAITVPLFLLLTAATFSLFVIGTLGTRWAQVMLVAVAAATAIARMRMQQLSFERLQVIGLNFEIHIDEVGIRAVQSIDQPFRLVDEPRLDDRTAKFRRVLNRSPMSLEDDVRRQRLGGGFRRSVEQPRCLSPVQKERRDRQQCQARAEQHQHLQLKVGFAQQTFQRTVRHEEGLGLMR